ncbi:hypothetical protein D3C72_2432390 [compost metagenome]
MQILDVFADSDAFEENRLTPVGVQNLEQWNLARWRNGEKPVWFVAKIDIDPLEGDPFLEQHDGNALNEGAEGMTDKCQLCL